MQIFGIEEHYIKNVLYIDNGYLPTNLDGIEFFSLCQIDIKRNVPNFTTFFLNVLYVDM